MSWETQTIIFFSLYVIAEILIWYNVIWCNGFEE